MQFLFVNSRPVNDRILYGALRGAYRDFLASNRFPLVALFLSVPPGLVDVNVHPAKTEVRFKDEGIVRGLIITAITHALSRAGHRASTTVSDLALGAIKKNLPLYQNIKTPSEKTHSDSMFTVSPSPANLSKSRAFLPNLNQPPSAANDISQSSTTVKPNSFPLGAARAQLHETYILAQTSSGIVIVDQHAAHERLVEEKIKKSVAEGGVKRQGLLIPEIVTLSEEDCSRLLSKTSELEELGLVIESFGQATIIVRETPALLGEINVKNLLQDLADDFSAFDLALTLKDQIGDICATMACHSSIRAGRRLSSDEMNSLLREMENTPHSGQCSHGRPTYIELKLFDIEKLFGRR